MRFLTYLFFVIFFSTIFFAKSVSATDYTVTFDGTKFDTSSLPSPFVVWNKIIWKNTSTQSATIKFKDDKPEAISKTIAPGNTDEYQLRTDGTFTFYETNTNATATFSAVHPTATPAPSNTPTPAPTTAPTATPKVSSTPTPSKTITPTQEALKTLNATDTDNQTAQVQGAQTQTNDNYTLSFKVLNSSNQPVQGVTISLFTGTEQTQSLTDINGSTTFNGVKAGTHLIKAQYKDQSLEDSVNITGDNKDISFTLRIKSGSSNLAFIIVVISAIVIVGAATGWMYYKNSKN